jgi:hypothetical protein
VRKTKFCAPRTWFKFTFTGLTDPVQIAGLKALYLGAEANSGVWAEVAPGLVDVSDYRFLSF